MLSNIKPVKKDGKIFIDSFIVPDEKIIPKVSFKIYMIFRFHCLKQKMMICQMIYLWRYFIP